MKKQNTLFPKPPKPDRTWVIGIGEQIWAELGETDPKKLTLYFRIVKQSRSKAYEALSITKERHKLTPENCKPLSRESMPRYFLKVFINLIKNK